VFVIYSCAKKASRDSSDVRNEIQEGLPKESIVVIGADNQILNGKTHLLGIIAG
jgi:hypothetical protein